MELTPCSLQRTPGAVWPEIGRRSQRSGAPIDPASRRWARRGMFPESCYSTPNFDCNYHFPIDLTPNGVPFSAKSIVKG